MPRGTHRNAALFLCLGLSSATACHHSENTTAVAQVDGQVVSVEDFRARFREFRVGQTTLPGTPAELTALKERVLNELIEEKVIVEEAKRRDLSVPPDELDRVVQRVEQDYPAGGFGETLSRLKISRARWRDRVRQQLLMEKATSEVVRDLPNPSALQIEQYFKLHPEEFHQEEQVRAQQIVVKSEEDAERIRSEVQKGATFEELARQHSFTPEAQQGGLLGFVSKGMLPPALEEVLFRLDVGKLSSVISTEYGFHVARVLERRPAKDLTLAEATPQIVRALTQKVREERISKWRQEILSKAKIERNHALLANIN